MSSWPNGLKENETKLNRGLSHNRRTSKQYWHNYTNTFYLISFVGMMHHLHSLKHLSPQVKNGKLKNPVSKRINQQKLWSLGVLICVHAHLLSPKKRTISLIQNCDVLHEKAQASRHCLQSGIKLDSAIPAVDGAPKNPHARWQFLTLFSLSDSCLIEVDQSQKPPQLWGTSAESCLDLLQLKTPRPSSVMHQFPLKLNLS